ncbi:hypothetical protein CPB86DRAFT_780290 [Serendipita vermifera]|nr:hypothetical protein CPB86DRAFT_780290 [Serendipita vermifera]
MRPEDEWTVVPGPRLDDMDELMKKIIITQLEQQDMCEQYTNSFRAKWDRFHDWVRDVFGLTAIERPLCGFQAILDNSSNPRVTAPAVVVEPAHPVKSPAYQPALFGGPPPTRVRGAMGTHGRWQQFDGGCSQRRRPASFTRRLQRAIYSLSPWEGRALAFVVGCGFGVLIRMVYVFIVIGFRWWQNRASDDDDDELKEEANEELEGVILFDAGSIKNLSLEDLPLYQEKP